MRLLADTHAFLWYLAGDGRMSGPARSALEDPDNEWHLSAASVWEVAIKSALGRLTLPTPATQFFTEKIREGLQVLPVDWRHAASVEHLPPHHRDPFDRLLIAQAQLEGLRIVTADPVFRKYGIGVVW